MCLTKTRTWFWSRFDHKKDRMFLGSVTVDQAPVVQKLDSAIHWINHHPVDNAIGFPNTYPLDSDLPGG